MAYVFYYAKSDQITNNIPVRFSGGFYNAADSSPGLGAIVTSGGEKTDATFVEAPTVLGEYYLAHNGSAIQPYWETVAPSTIGAKMSVFSLAETTSQSGAATFGIGGTGGGTVSSNVQNIAGLTGPTGSSLTARAFSIPAGTYQITVMANYTGLPSGSVSVITNLGPNPVISGSSDVSRIYSVSTKIQGGSDDMGNSGTATFTFVNDTYFYYTRYCGTVSAAASCRISGATQIIFLKLD